MVPNSFSRQRPSGATINLGAYTLLQSSRSIGLWFVPTFSAPPKPGLWCAPECKTLVISLDDDHSHTLIVFGTAAIGYRFPITAIPLPPPLLPFSRGCYYLRAPWSYRLRHTMDLVMRRTRSSRCSDCVRILLRGLTMLVFREKDNEQCLMLYT